MNRRKRQYSQSFGPSVHQRELASFHLQDAWQDLGTALLRAGRASLYKAAWLLSSVLPASSKRARKARTARYAKAFEDNTEKHGPLVLAVAINGIVLALAGMAAKARQGGGDSKPAAMEMVVDTGFFEPLGGGGAPPTAASTAQAVDMSQAVALPTAAPQASAEEMLNMVSANTATLNFAVKAMVPNAPSVQVANTVVEQAEAVETVEATEAVETVESTAPVETGEMTEATAFVGAGAEGSTNSTTVGPGHGPGYGTWNGERIGKRPDNAQAVGNTGPEWAYGAGKDALEGQDIFLLLDTSESMGGFSTSAVVDNIVGKNNLVGKTMFYFGRIDPPTQAEAEAASYTTRDKNSTHTLHESIINACKNYKGDPAILLVVSDFTDGSDQLENVPYMVEALLKAKLRLYVVRVMPGIKDRDFQFSDNPAPIITARMSGGSARYIPVEVDGLNEASIFPEGLIMKDPYQ